MESTDLKVLHEAFQEFKQVNDQLLAEVKKYGDASGDLKERIDRLQKEMDEREARIQAKLAEQAQAEARQKALEERLEDLKGLFLRKSGGAPAGEEADASERKRVFFKALRAATDARSIRHSNILTADELKALTVSNDNAGGYLAPPEYVRELLKNVEEFSNIRSIATVRPTSASAVQVPKKTRAAAAVWVAEAATRSETQTPLFGLEEIKAHEMHALAKVSNAELEDAAFDLEAFLREEFAEQFGVTEGAAFISGNGVAKPEGILTHPDVAYVPSGSASTITPDSLIALYYELKEAYLNNATWVMNRSTLKTIRQMKDDTNQYLWAPGIKADGSPATILDRPYLTCPDMPAIGANAYPVVFGDFRRGYMIVDRLTLDVMVDPYSSKNLGMTEFSARRRVGGQVVIAEALKKLRVATS
jgi:HK97 family phage major capsid protein